MKMKGSCRFSISQVRPLPGGRGAGGQKAVAPWAQRGTEPPAGGSWWPQEPAPATAKGLAKAAAPHPVLRTGQQTVVATSRHHQTDGQGSAASPGGRPGARRRGHSKPEPRHSVAGPVGEERPARAGGVGKGGLGGAGPRRAEVGARVIYSGWQEDNSSELKITPKPQHGFQLTAASQRSQRGGGGAGCNISVVVCY